MIYLTYYAHQFGRLFKVRWQPWACGFLLITGGTLLSDILMCLLKKSNWIKLSSIHNIHFCNTFSADRASFLESFRLPFEATCASPQHCWVDINWSLFSFPTSTWVIYSHDINVEQPIISSNHHNYFSVSPVYLICFPLLPFLCTQLPTILSSGGFWAPWWNASVKLAASPWSPQAPFSFLETTDTADDSEVVPVLLVPSCICGCRAILLYYTSHT